MSDTLYEYYAGLDNGESVSDPTHYVGQLFTVGSVGPSENHTITSLKLKLYKVGSPGIADLKVYVTDQSGTPSSVIGSTTFQGNDLTTDTAGVEYEFAITTTTLTATMEYAIVLRASNGSRNNEVHWRKVLTGLYDGGTTITSTDGISWTPAITDQIFYEYGLVEEAPPGETPEFPDSDSSDAGKIALKFIGDNSKQFGAGKGYTRSVTYTGEE